MKETTTPLFINRLTGKPFGQEENQQGQKIIPVPGESEFSGPGGASTPPPPQPKQAEASAETDN